MTMAETHLAIDLGASNGRAFLGEIRAGALCIRELQRFSNEPVQNGKSSHWDVTRLWEEIRKVLKSIEGTRLAGIGVDAWGVDYALLGERGELLQDPVHYRDARNVSAMEEILRLIPKEDIYSQTGVQFMPINTLNQLFAAQRDNPELLATARRFIMIPDLFHYWLTGNAMCEYTVASTTQFTNPVTRTWTRDLLKHLGLPAQLPAELVEAGTIVGGLLRGVSNSLAGTPVIAPASHDTASAVAAITARGNTAFLSSGTWSLIGKELDAPIVSDQALRMNFTNEGGVFGTTRLLKNVMGLWMLQGCLRTWAAEGRDYGYDELIEAARRAPAFRHLVDPDDTLFLNPSDMTEAIDRFCRKTDQPVPEGPGAYVRTVLESLALKYHLVIRDLETLTGEPIERIRVIGGGSRNQLLNQFTADATGKQVLAGPGEAAVLGNIGVQMLAAGGMSSLQEVRAIIDRSFPTEVFDAVDAVPWNREVPRFLQYCEFSYA
jgi:rhamnulokinase